MAELEATIAPDGMVTLRVVGSQGPACLRQTRDYEESLGMVIRDVKTADYYQRRATAVATTRERKVQI